MTPNLSQPVENFSTNSVDNAGKGVYGWFGRYPHERANHPVWSISAVVASMYASWLSRRLGRRFRLPTEAEWEYTASGPGWPPPPTTEFGVLRALYDDARDFLALADMQAA
jgi:formylglycine-generating enzyme required for sulfatase activity